MKLIIETSYLGGLIKRSWTLTEVKPGVWKKVKSNGFEIAAEVIEENTDNAK